MTGFENIGREMVCMTWQDSGGCFMEKFDDPAKAEAFYARIATGMRGLVFSGMPSPGQSEKETEALKRAIITRFKLDERMMDNIISVSTNGNITIAYIGCFGE
jgi:hypothetical protein